jgi:peptide/nickel transport system substrate-binding protein
MSPRYTELLFNLTETAHPLVQSLEGRQALAHALDREKLIDAVQNGQGVLLDGQYLPSSWAYNETLLTRYGFDVETAVSLLNTAGGQPDGVPLRLLALNDPIAQATANALISQWTTVGIVVELVTADNFTALRQQLDEQTFDIALLDIAPPADPDLYDFWSQEAIIRGSNYAGWNNRRASEALENGRKLWPLDERLAAYNTFTRLFEQNLPALTLYQHTTSYALSSTVQNADIGLITTARDRYKTMADWFLLYRDVAVSCPSEN